MTMRLPCLLLKIQKAEQSTHEKCSSSARSHQLVLTYFLWQSFLVFPSRKFCFKSKTVIIQLHLSSYRVLIFQPASYLHLTHHHQFTSTRQRRIQKNRNHHPRRSNFKSFNFSSLESNVTHDHTQAAKRKKEFGETCEVANPADIHAGRKCNTRSKQKLISITAYTLICCIYLFRYIVRYEAQYMHICQQSLKLRKGKLCNCIGLMFCVGNMKNILAPDSREKDT